MAKMAEKKSNPKEGPAMAAGANTKLQMLASGAIAGAVSRSVTAPIDRVKILYQVNPNRHFTLIGAMKSLNMIFKNTGLPGLWRGNTLAVARIAPFSAITYTSFSMYEVALAEADTFGPDSAISIRFAAGSAAGATATALTYPLDLVRARIAAHWSLQPRYTSFFSGVQEIIRKEGVSSLYAGLAPTMLGIIPYAGVSFAVFETLKAHMRERQDGEPISTPTRLLCGGTAGLVAQTATYPLHVVRRRMQVSGDETMPAQLRIAQGSNRLLAIPNTMLHICRSEGVKALYKGLTLSWMKAPVAVALSFTINDKLKTFLREYERDSEFGRPSRGSNHDSGGGSGGGSGTGTDEVGGSADTMDNPKDEAIDHVESHDKEHLTYALSRDPLERPVAPLGNVGKVPVPPVLRDLTFLDKFIAGGVAGAIAKTVIAPGDRVKILYQVNPNRPFSIQCAANTGKAIVNNHGPLALWRGNLATLIKVVPYSALTYATFDMYERAFSTVIGETNFWSRFLGGAAAGATATTATYPLDLIRARMAARWAIKPMSYGKTIAGVWKGRPTVTAFYAGLTPSLLGIFPYAGSSFAIFETLKSVYVRWKHLPGNDAIGAPTRLLFGGVAGLLAQSLTYPLDIVRRRMQVDATGEPLSMFALMRQVYSREGGITAFYKGLTMNYIKGPIAVSVSFVVNDTLKLYLRHRPEPSLD